MCYENEIYQKLGSNIKKYRIQKQLSQEKLSELLDANPKFVGHVERVERYISLKKIIECEKNLPNIKSFLWKKQKIYQTLGGLGLAFFCKV